MVNFTYTCTYISRQIFRAFQRCPLASVCSLINWHQVPCNSKERSRKGTEKRWLSLSCFKKTSTLVTCGGGTEGLWVLHLASCACKYLGIARHHCSWGFICVKGTLLSFLQLFYAHNLHIECNIYPPSSGFLMYLLCSAKAGRPSESKARSPQEKTIGCWYSVKSCLIFLCTSSPLSKKTTSLWRPAES